MSGHLGDRFGGRRMVTLGAILSCLFNWITSFGHGFWTLIVPWSLNNAMQSLGFAPSSRLIANWWGSRERGKAFGIFTFAAGFSSVLTFAGAILVLQHLSWVWIFRLPVLLMPIAALVFVLLVRDRPEEMGFASSERSRVGAEGAPRGQRASTLEGYREVLGNRRFLIACVGFGFNNLGRLALLVWVPVHFLGATWKEDPSAAWITLALPVGMALGALVAGYGTDRFFRADHLRLITPLLVLAAVTTLAILFVPTEHRVLGMALLFLDGFLVFGPVSSFTALGAELLGSRSLGAGIGLMNAVGYGTAALGDPFIGTVIDATGRTESMFVITAGACLLGAICSFSIRR